MPAGYLAIVRLKSSTGLPKDDVINTFAFLEPPAPWTDLIAGELFEGFYNVAHYGAHGIAWWMSNSIKHGTAAGHVDIYDLLDVEPRAPIASSDFNLDNSGADGPLPLEVSMCLSFRAEYASGSPKARHRGRVFIGSLGTGVLDSTDDDQPKPDVNFGYLLLGAAQYLFDETEGAWAVWSRTDDVLRPVTRASIDDEFDTQRRRGRRATARAEVPLTP